jgi:hypothetical protein
LKYAIDEERGKRGKREGREGEGREKRRGDEVIYVWGEGKGEEKNLF